MLNSKRIKNSLLFGLLILGIACFCSWKYLSPKVVMAQSTIPPAPTVRKQRFTAYHWNYSEKFRIASGSTLDSLNFGAEKLASLGNCSSGSPCSIRVYLGAHNIYHFTGLPMATDTTSNTQYINLSLADIAAKPQYAQLFSDPRFSTYLLTTYSRGANASNWSDGFTTQEETQERDEMRALSNYLWNIYPSKTFILLNWEADSAMIPFQYRPAIWDSFARWNKARVEGVQLAKSDHPVGPTRVYSGFEFTLTKRKYDGDTEPKPCGTTHSSEPLAYRCAMEYVAPQLLDVDYLSYSAWETVNNKLDAPYGCENPGPTTCGPNYDLTAGLNSALESVRAKVNPARTQAGKPLIAPANFIIGEYGFASTLPTFGEKRAAKYVEDAIIAMESYGGPNAGVSYGVYWQVLDDNAIYGGPHPAGGLFRDTDLQRSHRGEAFAQLLAKNKDERITVPPTFYDGGPLLASQYGHPKISSLPNYTNVFDIGESIANRFFIAFGNNFSTSGNKLRIEQENQNFTDPTDNPYFWYESPTQINGAMPTGLRQGWPLVYVTDASGLHSDGEQVLVQCITCPYLVMTTNPSQARYDSGAGAIVSWPYYVNNFYRPNFDPNDYTNRIMIIKAKNITSAGNKVVVIQVPFDVGGPIRRWELPQANPANWWEGPDGQGNWQINATLPADMRTGEAIIYVVKCNGGNCDETNGLNVTQPMYIVINRLLENRYTVNFQTDSQKYMVAMNGGGGSVEAHNTIPAEWETFNLFDLNGGRLTSGDKVWVQTYSGQHFMYAVNGGGAGVSASLTFPGTFGVLTILKMKVINSVWSVCVSSPSDPCIIRDNDTIAIKAPNDTHYFVAEGGGGSVINANRTAINAWERFKIKIVN